MNILAIESSCDETAVAIVADGRKVLTDRIHCFWVWKAELLHQCVFTEMTNYSLK